MAFQPINFSGIAPQGNPWMRDIANNLSAGYKAGQLPAQMERQRQQEEIANAMSKLLYQEQPEKFKSEMTGNSLTNALKQLQLQQQPQLFQSQLSGSNLANQLNQLKLKAMEMEVDPAKKLDYISKLSQGFGTQGSAPGSSNPLVQAMIRKSLGLPAQSPEEKNAAALDLYKQKQQAKASGEVPTNAFITGNQQTVQAIDNTLPLLRELQASQAPGQLIGQGLHPQMQADYEAKLAGITDSLVSAMKLPKTNESIALVEKMLARRPFDSDKSYANRLKAVQNDLIRRRGQSLSSIKSPLSSDNNNSRVFNLESGSFE